MRAIDINTMNHSYYRVAVLSTNRETKIDSFKVIAAYNTKEEGRQFFLTVLDIVKASPEKLFNGESVVCVWLDVVDITPNGTKLQSIIEERFE